MEHALTTLEVLSDGGIGEIVLNRPDRLNALSGRMLEELIAAAEHFDAAREVKVVIVRGAGRAFTGGADLTGMGGSPAGDDAVRAMFDLGRRMADAIGGMRAITIASIHGHCVGGGVVLASACDIRVAAAQTRFAIPEVDLGIPLLWGGIPRLAREIGPALTKELVLTCRRFDAEEARGFRFVNRVVKAGKLDSETRSLAEKLASQPAYSLELTKRQIDAVAEQAGTTADAGGEVDLAIGALKDPESLEAMARYLEARRRP